MGLIHDLIRRFTPPRLDDPVFGPLVYMHIPNAPDRSYWEAQWLFPPTGYKVEIALLGDKAGPIEEARRFYLALPARFPDVLAQVKPVLDGVFRHWYDRPMSSDFWQDVKLAGFGLDDPRSHPLKWDIGFEATGKKWLGITIPFEGDMPGEAVVDT